MPAPVVSWNDYTTGDTVNSWSIGVVDAGSTSDDKRILIWNNKGGSSAVSDMTNATITTKDSSGGNTGEVVVDKWIEAKINSLSETTFTQIGGDTTKAIGSTSGSGTISGAINDGVVANSVANFADVTLHAVVPALAGAGNTAFLTRVGYQYV